MDDKTTGQGPGFEAGGPDRPDPAQERHSRRRQPVLRATPTAKILRHRTQPDGSPAPGRGDGAEHAGDGTPAPVVPAAGRPTAPEMDWPALDLPDTENRGDTPAAPAPGPQSGESPDEGVGTTRVPAGGAGGAGGEPAVAEPAVAEEPPRRRRLSVAGVSPGWRTVVTVLMAVVVLVWVGRGLVGSGGGSPEPAKPAAGDRVAVPEKPKTVAVDGTAIQRAGVLITLNPAIAQPGGQVALSGQGFDARAAVDIVLSHGGAKTGRSLGSFRADRAGNIGATLTMPDDLGAGPVTITARQRNSNKVATVQAAAAAGLGFAKVSTASGKPGDTISVNARGFGPGEAIKVYWGRVSGTPTATLQADQGGAVRQASVKVGFQPPGTATMVLVGAKTGTTATVPFYMQGLYPTAGTQPYSLKAGETLGLSGGGFAPGERVQTFVNASSGQPLLVTTADAQGNVGGVSFKVPFGLKGEQRVVMLGELSRASVTSGFQVLPYTPSVQPSTYGGSPGTSFSFFAKGFAANEVVLVYLNRSPGAPPELVSAFRVNDQGDAGAAGSYLIGASDSGTLRFTLEGRLSEGKASAAVRVSPAQGPVDLPSKKPYTLPPSLRKD